MNTYTCTLVVYYPQVREAELQSEGGPIRLVPMNTVITIQAPSKQVAVAVLTNYGMAATERNVRIAE